MAWLTTLGALLLAVALCSGVVLLAGKSPLEAGKALLQGATGVELQFSPFQYKFSSVRLTQSLLKTIPLIMTGLSVALAFRAGFFNIGAEGQFLLGAITCAGIATKLGQPLPWVLAGGALAGALWALIAGLLKTRRGAPEIITTIMLNYIALRLVEFAVHGPLQETADLPQPRTDMLPEEAQMPILLANTPLHAGLVVALLCAAACWWLLFRTERGFLLRAVGAGPVASKAHGIRVEANVLFTVALCGALSGLGGAMEVAGVTKQMTPNGFDYGYTAIAVALLARLSPLAVVPAALLFGMLSAGGGAMERNTGVPAVTVSIISAIVICMIAVLPRLKKSQ